MKKLVVGALIAYAVIAAAFLVWSYTDAREPTAHGVSEPASWPCLQPGWTAGDHWGPGPNDIVPDAPPCPPVSAPAPAPSEEAYVGHWLPSTDTDHNDAITVIAIWVVAIIVIVFCWHYMAYHDD